MLELARPALSLFAKTITHVGTVGSGHAVKAMNNVLNATHLLATAEALCTLSKLGVDPAQALTAINASSGRSMISEVRFPQDMHS